VYSTVIHIPPLFLVSPSNIIIYPKYIPTHANISHSVLCEPSPWSEYWIRMLQIQTNWRRSWICPCSQPLFISWDNVCCMEISSLLFRILFTADSAFLLLCFYDPYEDFFWIRYYGIIPVTHHWNVLRCIQNPAANFNFTCTQRYLKWPSKKLVIMTITAPVEM